MAKTQSINLRISAYDQDLIDRAASLLRKSRTDFLLDSARAAATDALLDERLFILDNRQHAALANSLKQAPTTSQVLGDLKKRPSPWKE